MIGSGLPRRSIQGATASPTRRSIPGLAGSPLLTVAKWGLASALILPQSGLLGATFPLMTAGVLRLRRREEGRLPLDPGYFANSFGGAIGVLVAGFYLVALPGYRVPCWWLRC